MNEKQQQLTFDKGITNVPSDLLCSDNTLEESVGMIYDDGEHRVIQNPVRQMSISTLSHTKILYIHKFDDKKRYVFLFEQPGSTIGMLYWGYNVNGTLTPSARIEGVDLSTTEKIGKLKITSVGKTLVVADCDKLHYYLWMVDADSYKPLGDIPSQSVDFYLVGQNITTAARYGTNSSSSYRGILTDAGGPDQDAVNAQEDYNNLVIGLYSKNKKVLHQKKWFCGPFFVRTALELYDGSYTYISQPILLFPSVYMNSIGHLNDNTKELTLYTYGCALWYKNNSHFEDWTDIVKDVVVFVSDEIDVYDTASDQFYPQAAPTDSPYYNGVYRYYGDNESTYHQRPTTTSGFYYVLRQRGQTDRAVPISTDHSEIVHDIEATSVFYKLCSIGAKYDYFPRNISERIETHTLENLLSQEMLEYDDYYSRSFLSPDFIYSYNSRLNIANVKRSFFEGYGFFTPYDQNDVYDYRFYVEIETDNGTKLVRHEENNTKQLQGIWFFYPDSRAKSVKIFKKVTSSYVCILNAELKEHTGLNGAYYFKGLPGPSESEPTLQVDEPTYTTPTPEILSNYILTSEVDNPFVFKAEGYYKVSTGKIVAMSSITQAISQGQFGQYPLLVFSTEGIWAMSVASTGYYNSIHPISREVCNNTKSIAQTDGAVFFSSEKGLMVVVGNDVKCVSEQLSGKEYAFTGEIAMGNFHDYIKAAHIAYDYRDSLLWIFNSNKEYCYVYSIKSGTFGKCHFTCQYAVNDYPDYILSNVHDFYSFIDRTNINLDNTNYSGLMITRPMKLENGLALKSLMQIMHIKQLSSGASMTMQIYASNNVNNWVELHSLRGTPWKYYRFRFDFSNLKAVDRFSGTMVITQERRTDKLR